MTEHPPTSHVVKVTYTEKLVRLAATLYWKRGIGNSGLISFGVIAVSCLVMAYLGVDSWIVSFFTGVGIINGGDGRRRIL